VGAFKSQSDAEAFATIPGPCQEADRLLRASLCSHARPRSTVRDGLCRLPQHKRHLVGRADDTGSVLTHASSYTCHGLAVRFGKRKAPVQRSATAPRCRMQQRALLRGEGLPRFQTICAIVPHTSSRPRFFMSLSSCFALLHWLAARHHTLSARLPRQGRKPLAHVLLSVGSERLSGW
jgi:hypothetical protein